MISFLNCLSIVIIAVIFVRQHFLTGFVYKYVWLIAGAIGLLLLYFCIIRYKKLTCTGKAYAMYSLLTVPAIIITAWHLIRDAYTTKGIAILLALLIEAPMSGCAILLRYIWPVCINVDFLGEKNMNIWTIISCTNTVVFFAFFMSFFY